MVNVVIFMGVIVKDDPDDKLVRYVEVVEEYRNISGQIVRDIIPVINWKKTNKGSLFSFPVGSLVMIKGHLENYLDKFIVVCENINYLGKN